MALRPLHPGIIESGEGTIPPGPFGICSIGSLRAQSSIAALALVCTCCARSPQDWRADLGDADPFRRGMSALALARVAPADCAEAIPRLLELVDSPELGLGPAARAELERVARHHVPQLLENLTGVEDASADFRSALRAALVAAGADAVAPLRAKLLDAGASNPRELGQILADIGPSAVGPVAADLEERELRRRLYAAWILARLGAQAAEAAPALAERLERDEPPVARQAALALAEVAPLAEATRRTLEGAFARRGSELGGALREALARLALNRVRLGTREDTQAQLFAAGAEALVPAVEACAAKDPALRAAGERLLRLRYGALALGLLPAGIGGERDPARLQERLDDRDPGTRARAAFEIAALGARAEGFVTPLAARVHDRSAGVALGARLALLHVLRALALAEARRRG